MPPKDTPPNSPAEIIEEEPEEEDEFNENDVAEVYELDGDEEWENGVDEDVGEPIIEEQEEYEPETDDAKLVFSKHTDGVLSCAFHPTANNIAVTGGIDDLAYVWDVTDSNVIFTCKGHEESVEAIAFSYNGAFLATADLNGKIQVWKTSDFSLNSTFELEDELSWMEWHHGANVLIAASQSGIGYMYKVPSGESKMIMTSFGQNCTSGKILPDGKRLVCGYQDGSIKIVDLKLGTILNNIKPNIENTGVTCLDTHKDNNLIICGCEDGCILLLSIQSGKVASVLNASQNQDGGSYIEAVSFCKDPNYPVAASGSLDGTLIIWDISKQTIRFRHNFPSSINHLIWHPNLPIVYTCHVDGIARIIDAKSGTVIKELKGHRKCCLNMDLSKDGTMLMTCSEDKTARIFDVLNVS